MRKMLINQKLRLVKYSLFLLSMVIGGLSVSSCSILVPYHQHYTCKMPPAHGVCGSVFKVYEETVKDPKKFGIKEE